jgi:tetratricopeptide (TPR) repeat protein
VWERLCESYRLTGEPNLAVDPCERNVELDPSTLPYIELGLVDLTLKDYEHAANAFEKATADYQLPQRLYPPAIIYENLLWSLFGSKQYGKAVSSAKRLIKIGTNDPAIVTTGYEMLGAAYDKIGQESQARAAFDRANVKWCQVVPNDETGNLGLDCHD